MCIPVGLFMITCTGWQPRVTEELFHPWKDLCFSSSFPFVVHRPETCVFQVYVLKRPHVDEFLQKMGELFECVLFTASLAKVFLFCFLNSCGGRKGPFSVSWFCSAFAPLTF